MKSKKPTPLAGDSLPSYFAALRFACDCFAAEAPELNRMLQIIRQREKEPDKYFPQKINRPMLIKAAQGFGEWASKDHQPLATIAKQTLYDQIRRHDSGSPLLGVAGDFADHLTFALLRLYEQIAPRLKIDNVFPHDCMWVMIENVFIPTAFIEFKNYRRRGLSGEFEIEDNWYLPKEDKGQISTPFPRVLHYLFHAVGYRYTHDIGKTSTDSLRRKADHWLKDGVLPKKDSMHKFIQKLADAKFWVERADDWESRLMLARAAENLCKKMDEYFKHQENHASLKLDLMLNRITKESIAIDSGLELAQPQVFFAARLLQKNLQEKGLWEKEILNKVTTHGTIKVIGGISEEEIEPYRRDMDWRTKPGNWFLEFIKREAAKSNLDGTLSEQIFELGIIELNRILDTKRGQRANAR